MRNLFFIGIFLSVLAPRCFGQDWQWSAGVIGYQSNACPTDLKLDAAGDLVVCGWFDTLMQLPVGTYTHPPTTTARSEGFLAKYDVNRNCIWAKQFGGRTQDYFMSLAINSQGEIIVAGASWSDTLILGPDTLFCVAGGFNTFVAKFDSTGNPLWARGGGGLFSDIPYAIAVDDSDNIYVAGESTSSSANYGPFTINGGYFLLKYDSQGNILWARDRQGGGWQGASDIAIDNDNNVIVVGNCPTGSTFGSFNLGLNNMFIAKYSPTGNVLWAKGLYGNGTSYAYSVCVDESDNVYLAGTYHSNICSFGTLNTTNPNSNISYWVAYYASCDSAGNERWINGITLGYNVEQMPTRLDYSSGQVLMTGISTIDTLNVGTSLVNNLGGEDIYVARFDTSGNISLTTTAANYGVDRVYAIDSDSLDNFYIAGWTCVHTQFGVYDQDYKSFFVAKYGPIVPPQCHLFSNFTSVCAGDSVVFYDSTMNAPSSWQWSFPGGTPSTSNLQFPAIHYNTPGTYDVDLIASNSAGSDTLHFTNMIFVSGLPLPVISYSGDTLVSSYSNGNQWYRNMQPLVGANQQKYLPSISGSYTVRVFDSLCISMSLPVTFTVGLNEVETEQFMLYPNPATTEIILISAVLENTQWKLYDAMGNVHDLGTTTNGSAKINLEGLPSGVYWIEVNNHIPRRFVKTSE